MALATSANIHTPLSPRAHDDSFSGRTLGTTESSRLKTEIRNSWRHTLGIALLLVTVVLWTASNFLASTIFADNTYSKPYFVTYINTAFFVIPLIPMLIRHAHQHRSEWPWPRSLLDRRQGTYKPLPSTDHSESRDAFKSTSSSLPQLPRSPSSSLHITDSHAPSPAPHPTAPKLTLRQTARLSLEFSILWFLANYSTAACLSYTTVASSTILTSTSSIWTLLFGSLLRIEAFTWRKLLGVLASLAGIALISSVDLYGENNADEHRGSFPRKSRGEVAVGDALALASAVLYGVYAVVMKKRIGDEARVSMPLFFGLVGAFNVALLWPGMLVLHLLGVERFELPPTGRVLAIVLVNSSSSLVSDFCWAYAMLLTSPLVVTVGLSLTIPLSLVGQMVISQQYMGVVYWIGAGVVVLSFVFINHEESKEEEASSGVEDGILYDEAHVGTS